MHAKIQFIPTFYKKYLHSHTNLISCMFQSVDLLMERAETIEHRSVTVNVKYILLI